MGHARQSVKVLGIKLALKYIEDLWNFQYCYLDIYCYNYMIISYYLTMHGLLTLVYDVTDLTNP